MNRRLWFSFFLSNVLIGLAAPSEAREVRTLRETYPAAQIETLRLDLPLGELAIEGTDGDEIEVSVRIDCSWRRKRCEERAEQVELLARERGNRFDLSFEGLRKWRSLGMSLEVRVSAPSRLELDLDVGIGEVEVAHFHNDVTIDLGIGELTVEMDESRVGTVSLDTGLGEARMSYRGGDLLTKGLFKNKVHWNEGKGPARLEFDLGIGEIDLRLN